MHNFRKILFSASILGLLLAIACTKLGPVPDFEYSYDFKPSLPEIDTTTLRSETINIVPGSIDVSGYSNFSSAITNPATASNYAAAVNSAFTAGQQAFWNGQTQASILALLQAGDANARAQVSAAISSFQSNGTLTSLVPTVIPGSGNLISNAGRISSRVHPFGGNSFLKFAQFFLVQDQELEDCRQAAIEAFNIAQTVIDDLLAQQLANIQTQFNNQSPLTEAQRPALESAAQSRHNTRLTNYLAIYNTADGNIATLFGAGDITIGERDLLNILNLAIYGVVVDASISLLSSELSLINTLIAQATTNLTNTRDSLIATSNTNYTNEQNRLIRLRDLTISKCHNQGGTNVS
ncbi:MAG: hypothetical protein KI791_21340 [Cyclobacteriaceae bacterium]|nr:hypothetical protein [Cyclobacteriaceae bacterium SS2]